MKHLLHLLIKLSLFVALSSVPRAADAHEILPAIADLSADQGVLSLEIRLNLEAQLAGIDLDQLVNTDDSENSGDYDSLRAEPNVAIAARAGQVLTGWNALPMVRAGEAPIEMRLVESITEDVEDFDLPRLTTIRLTGDLPVGVQSIVVAWPKGSGPMVLRQQGVDEPYTGFLENGAETPPIDLKGGGAQGGWQTFLGYIPVGFDHIVPKGLDHILFVLGLFFLSTRLGPLLWQISAFTLAHTVTLAFGALGWVNVPGSIVEPLIAASIVYVAVENIFSSGLSPWRPAVVFAFGLLHGLGFASVLGEFGLPTAQFIPALIGFNVGVELGQLAVIAAAFVLVGAFARKDWYRKAISIPASLAIAAVGAFWVIERTLL